MSVVDDLIHLFHENIVATLGTLDHEGTWTATTTTVTVPCRFEGEVRMVRNASGQEVASTLNAIVGGAPNFNPIYYRFTIPTRFTPNENLTAIAVLHETDQTSTCYEEIFFP